MTFSVIENIFIRNNQKQNSCQSQMKVFHSPCIYAIRRTKERDDRENESGETK